MKTYENTYTKSLKLSERFAGNPYKKRLWKLRNLECFVRGGAEVHWNT